jgi:putative hydrolase of the HAD superfamily
MRMLPKSDILQHLRPLAPLPTGCTPTGRPRAAVRSVLFDVYGTLFISASGDIAVSRAQASGVPDLADLLRKYGIDKSAADVLQDFYSAIDAAHAAARRSGIQHPEVDILRIWQAVVGLASEERLEDFAVEFEVIANPVYPMPHLPAVLDALRSRTVTMGLISNAQFYTPLLFEWFFDAEPRALGFQPDLTFFSYRAGRAKPSPVLFDAAAAALNRRGIDNSAVLYIGNDMLNDILPAHTAGFQTALFAGDRRSLRLRKKDARCRRLKPDMVITDLIQLVNLV